MLLVLTMESSEERRPVRPSYERKLKIPCKASTPDELDKIEKEFENKLSEVLREHGLEPYVVIIDGSIVDPGRYVRVTVNKPEHFIDVIWLRAFQESEIEGIPLLLVKRRERTILTYSLLDYVNEVLYTLTISVG